MGKFVGEALESWGNYLYVKKNSVELFAKEIEKSRFKDDFPSIFLSSVTDAWQGPEKKYRLSRGILEILVQKRYQGRISLLTKSPLIARDLDLLTHIPDVEVGITVTTDEDNIGILYEGRAPKNSERLKTLKKINMAGVPSYAFVGPLMTHYLDEPSKLDRLCSCIAETGVSFIYAELLNVSSTLMRRMASSMKGNHWEIDTFIKNQISQSRRNELSSLVTTMARRHGLTLRLGHVLDHAADRKRR